MTFWLFTPWQYLSRGWRSQGNVATFQEAMLIRIVGTDCGELSVRLKYTVPLLPGAYGHRQKWKTSMKIYKSKTKTEYIQYAKQ